MRYKIKSMIKVNFNKLLTKIVNLIFKYILNNYFIKFDWRCSGLQPSEKEERELERGGVSP